MWVGESAIQTSPVRHYEFKDDEISIQHEYKTFRRDLLAVTQPLYDEMFKLLVKHRSWVNGTSHRWNLHTLSSYADFRRFSKVHGVILSYEDLPGETSVFSREKEHNCQAWKVETSQQQFVIVMHVICN